MYGLILGLDIKQEYIILNNDSDIESFMDKIDECNKHIKWIFVNYDNLTGHNSDALKELIYLVYQARVLGVNVIIMTKTPKSIDKRIRIQIDKIIDFTDEQFNKQKAEKGGL